ncbi:tRNA (uridine(34)/cytosine(34)/5-carboxymethylaminomethyluridine(34)-2'-O)-methyltransferase TrmL [Deltaproteobacteria bacterium Smac51]|nr:tRNA (uridine(34)/cytosine(34)/5-carboxymethylaminomethyluridine(34)-2'-O)-methyltransferase TrmL [Deltaproteobacteria bacterium Smac51]
MDIILYEPEIPPNTGNVARLCAALGLKLNLIEPLGFKIDDKHLKRAGLDYWPHVDLAVWSDWKSFKNNWLGGKLLGTSARGGELYSSVNFSSDMGLVFGPETRGLPESVKKDLDGLLRVPIRQVVRSINLATCVGLVTGEAVRQTGLWPE